MTTGYEAKMYGDISRGARALERIAESLEKLAMKPTIAQYEALCGVIDSVKMDDRSKDTDEYAGEALSALGLVLED